MTKINAAEKAAAELSTRSSDDLVAESQALGEQADAIRARRLAIRGEIDRRLSAANAAFALAARAGEVAARLAAGGSATEEEKQVLADAGVASKEA